MVSDVAAIFVATTTFLTPSSTGANTRFCISKKRNLQITKTMLAVFHLLRLVIIAKALNHFLEIALDITVQAYIKYFSSWQHAFIQNKFPATLYVYLKYCATMGFVDKSSNQP